MKKALVAAVLAGGLTAGGVVSQDAEAAPLTGNGNFVLDLVGGLTSAASPIITPLVGNAGIQGALLPVLFVGQGILAELPQIDLVNGLLDDTVQPVLGIVIPAAAPLVVGVLTLDVEMILSGTLDTAGVVVGELVPALLGAEGSGLLSGLLGGGDGRLGLGLLGGGGDGLLGGILGSDGLVGGLLGGNGALLGGGGDGLLGLGLLSGDSPGLLGGLLGSDGLVGGLLGSGGLVGGLLGG